MMDFDDILPYIGGFGRFQMYVYGLLCLPIFYMAMPGLAKIFLLSVPDHWCQTEGVDAWNLTLEEVKNLTLPLELKYGLMTYSQCRMYDVNFSEVLANGGSPVGDITWPVTPCKHGWVYDKTYYMDTAASEWDLVCDKAVMASTILTVIGAAGIPGLFIFGTIGD
ncbi:PREDICTED: solute carrier family 22 member 21-like, partial [Priapulus caudatus]|uniref:Solute carrier family 22 member 21-like n=1 Tax=Priapulus caudatus TaxID=37621 RepID=A0ABM1F5Y0_PRICU